MYNINAIKKLSEVELSKGLSKEEASWHHKYKDSSYIYIGGLNYNLSEGDVIVVFSQWGSPLDINLIRDSKTGKSKGFAFLAYEDQRSTTVAVDNANGMTLVGRRIRVDHVGKYRAPEKFSSTSNEPTVDGPEEELIPYQATGAEGWGIGVSGVVESVRIQHGCGGAAYKPIADAVNASSSNDGRNSKVKQELSETGSQRPVSTKREGSESAAVGGALRDADEIWALNFEASLKAERKESKRHKKHRKENSSKP